MPVGQPHSKALSTAGSSPRRSQNGHSTPHPTASLSCRLITDAAGWEGLAPVWDDLLAASPDHTPWQGFAFLTAWWKHLSEGMPLRLYVVERGDTPCLVLPLQISRWKSVPGLAIRMLEPVAMINDVNRPRLALGRLDPDAYRCAFDAIWQRRTEWDLLSIDEKPWDDAEMQLLKAYCQERGWIFRQHYSHLVPYLDLRQAYPDFIKTKSQKFRKNLKTARRRLEQHGPVTLRHYRSAAEVEEGFAAFLRIHEHSWKKDKKIEQSKSPEYNAFFETWLRAMAARGQCSILALWSGEDPVAATIAFTEDDVYYSAQIVHDGRFSACSPGTLLESLELEHLMGAQTFARYEFLGSFLNNKMRWADAATHTALIEVVQPSLRTFLMDTYDATVTPYIRPQLKRAYQRLPPALQTGLRKAVTTARRVAAGERPRPGLEDR